MIRTLAGEIDDPERGVKHNVLLASYFSLVFRALVEHSIAAAERQWGLPELLNNAEDVQRTRKDCEEPTMDAFATDAGRDSEWNVHSGDSSEMRASHHNGDSTSGTPHQHHHGAANLRDGIAHCTNTDGAVPPAIAMHMTGAWPYWKSAHDAVTNDMHLEGMTLLSGPNMSGKSTQLRVVATIALLAQCGFAAPCASASVPRLDGICLRMTGAWAWAWGQIGE